MIEKNTAKFDIRPKQTKEYLIVVISIYILLVVDIILLNNGNINMPTVCWVLVCIYTLFLSPELIFLELITILPVTHAFKLINSITTFPIIACIFLTKLVLRNRKIENNFLLIYVTLFCVNSISSLIQFGTILYIMPFFVYFMMTYVASRNLSLTEELYELCIKCFVISVIIVCIGSKVLPEAANYMNNSTKYTVRNCGFSNVWDFGQNISMSIIALLMAIKHKKINIWLAIILLCFFSYFLIETGLYTGLIGIAFTIICFPFLSKENKISSLRINFGSAVVAIIVLLIGYYIIFPKMNILRNNIGLYDNGRYNLWKYYINLWYSQTRIMLTGIGAETITSYASNYEIRTAHNMIIEKLVEFGIIGFSLLVFGVREIVKNNSLMPLKNNKAIFVMSFFAMGMVQGISGAEVVYLFLIISSCKLISEGVKPHWNINIIELKT